MKRSVLNVVLTLLVVYSAICLLVFLLQARLVYFPGGPPRTTPRAYGLEFREVDLVTADGVRLDAWFLPAAVGEQPAVGQKGGAIVFCHGNAGNIEYRIASARAFLDMGISVLLFDYRGYGASEGTPTEAGTYLDAEAAYDHLAGAGFAADGIALYGESLGGAVAIELATRRPVAGVFVESAFLSASQLGQEVYPWLPVKLLSRFRYDNLGKLPAIAVPVLVAHSADDDVVPFRHGEALYAVAREPKRFLVTSGGHNDGGFLQRDAWRAEVRAFLVETCQLLGTTR